VTLAEQLIGKGLQLSVYDPEVHLSQLLGANRLYIEKHLPHIGQLVRADIGAVIGESELVVVGIRDATVLQGLKAHLKAEHVVLDLVNLPAGAASPAKVHGLNW
jgi:GDP-mannose 6-dehydrogenase